MVGERPEAWAPQVISCCGAFLLVLVLAPAGIWAGTKTKKRQSLADKTQDTKTPLASVVDVE